MDTGRPRRLLFLRAFEVGFLALEDSGWDEVEAVDVVFAYALGTDAVVVVDSVKLAA